MDESRLFARFQSGEPCGVAVHDSHIYWADHSGTTIGRAISMGRVQIWTSSPANSFRMPLSALAHMSIGSVSKVAQSRQPRRTGLVQPFISDPGAGKGGFAVNGSYIYWEI